MNENDFLAVAAIAICTATVSVRVTVAILRHKAAQRAADRKLKGAQS